ncbi:hypothetical protein ABDK00_009805 [Niabella insulamsoli]|uniref:hypothetical protein n=1 Tax=Niabella insulamsoli TaxID=3144874 RepID=UPI0031FD3AC0
MKLFQFFLILALSLTLASCCHCSKPQKTPAAKDALPDRNTRDPKIKDNPPSMELRDSSLENR